MKARNYRIIAIIMTVAIMLSLLPTTAFAAVAAEDPVTQREYVTAKIKAAGFKESMIGNERDQDALAETLGFHDNWEYDATALVTAEVAAAMDAAMLGAFTGLRDALNKSPMEPYFVHGMAQPIFPFGEGSYFDTSGVGVARFVVYVETDYDTDADGKLDLIKVLVQLPRAAVTQGMKVSTIYHAQPYNEGTNGSGVSFPAAIRPEGQAWLDANGGYPHEKLHLTAAPRVPAGEATTAQMVASANHLTDWRYRYTYNSTTYNSTVEWGHNSANQMSSTNAHDYFVVRGFALVSSAGLSTVGGEGIATNFADVELDAYKKVIDWLNGTAVAYSNKTDNIQVKADWSNGLVGMTGTSYGGTMPMGVATSGVKGLETIIPVAAIISGYEYQNQQGVMNSSAGYTAGLTWYILSRIGTSDWEATSQIRARQLAYMQQLYLESVEFGGNYSDHWARRDFSVDGWYKDWGPSKIHASILIVHGGNDNNVRPKQSVLIHQAAKKAGVDTKFIWDQGHHMTPNNHQIGDFVYQEWQNLWFSHYLYKIDNNVLELMPDFIAQSNITGDYEDLGSFEADHKLILDNDDRVIAEPAPFGIASMAATNNYVEPVESEVDFFLMNDEEKENYVAPVAIEAATAGIMSAAATISATTAEDDFITINSARGSSSWQNFLDAPTEASTLYSILLPEDITVKGVVELNFRAALQTLGSNLNVLTGRVAVHAKLVEIAAPNKIINAYGTEAVGATISTHTVTSGGVYRGGGLSSSNLIKFTPATNLKYRELARGWMDLAHPYSGYDSNTSHFSNRINLGENIGVFHDYTLYLQPTVHTAKKGNRLAVILTTGTTNTAGYTGNNAFTFAIDNNETYVSIPVAEQTFGNLRLTTDAHLVEKGQYFNVTPYFHKAVNSNAAAIELRFDKEKFEYRGFTPAAGVTLLNTVQTENGILLTVMVDDYNTTDYGKILFSAYEDVDLKKEDSEISASVSYVVKQEDDEKIVLNEIASTIFTTTDGDPIEGGEYTLITLSNAIDGFGVTANHADWAIYRFYDFNNNNVIDVSDIAVIASKITI